MHKVLHPKDKINRVYVLRKEGGKGLEINEDHKDATILRLKEYVVQTKPNYSNK